MTAEQPRGAEERYVPAAGRAAFTSVYDLAMHLTMREGTWRPRLIRHVLEGDPESVLDLGCGTGTLTLALRAAAPQVSLVGVDGDPRVLALARGKAGPSSEIEWLDARADALPFEDARFDRVVTSLLLHHLGPRAKADALREARRVLRPGGRIHVADWGRPRDLVMAAAFVTLRLIDGFENTRDHARAALPAMLAAAGFVQVRLEDRLRTGWGSLELLSART
jgi:ubiquinone/menaquinone biosynthesis C-methylase UbiE